MAHILRWTWELTNSYIYETRATRFSTKLIGLIAPICHVLFVLFGAGSGGEGNAFRVLRIHSFSFSFFLFSFECFALVVEHFICVSRNCGANVSTELDNLPFYICICTLFVHPQVMPIHNKVWHDDGKRLKMTLSSSSPPLPAYLINAISAKSSDYIVCILRIAYCVRIFCQTHTVHANAFNI